MLRLTLLFLILASLTATAQTNASLVGRWEGIQANDTIELIFEKDSIATMTNKTVNQTLGGSEIAWKGKMVQLIYRVDASTTPHTIDLVIRDIATKTEYKRLTGIFELLSDRELKINLGSGKGRPATFDQDTLIATKQE